MNSIPFKPKNGPDQQKVSEALQSFIETIATLRDPEKGCPWDLEQTHKSLKRYMIEEAFEAAEAMDDDDPKELCAELGDVLLQVVLNSQLALDQKDFSLVDVIQSIDAKMRRRHPHVFGSKKERGERKISQIKDKWKQIKAEEKAQKKKGQQQTTEQGIFASEKIEKIYPSTRQAYQIGKVAKKINFDWPNSNDVFNVFLSEVDELKAEWENLTKKGISATEPSPERSKLLDELGDVYFSLAQFCRHIKDDPETIAWGGNQKFLRRFKTLEAIANNEKLDIRNLKTEQLEELWVKAKAREK